MRETGGDVAGRVLALNYDGDNDYASMLPELAGQIVVLSQEPLANVVGLAHYEQIDDLEKLPLGAERAHALHAEQPFSAVITDNEYEIVRCGQLRDEWGIRGQSAASALAFRDKVAMKDAARLAVEVPAYARAASRADVESFADKYGFPLILKPVDQGGSRGIQVLRRPQDLTTVSAQAWAYEMEIEQFVEGDIYHVDALVTPDIEFVSAARYSLPPLQFLHGSPLAHVLIEPDAPITRRLGGFLRALLDVMPAPESAAYHLEVVRTPDDRLVFCEIACRVGGAQIPELVQRTYGFDLVAASFRASCGLSLPQRPEFAGRVYSSLIVPSPGGFLRDAPAELPFDWVDRYTFRRAVGKAIPASRHSNDHVVCVVFHAEEHASALLRLQELEAFLLPRMIWAPVDDGT
ncbi:ATP-grasp domain-containing protein [Micromonospora sp. KLBMP9576]|uniref:ATP-grasp domain-containing protein n=1 Tax=Micromonospora sp. KLBMP9576 TaxID=3424769 RepID=UPI003D92793C